jgi:hypothetical protein
MFIWDILPKVLHKAISVLTSSEVVQKHSTKSLKLNIKPDTCQIKNQLLVELKLNEIKWNLEINVKNVKLNEIKWNQMKSRLKQC